jgi:hypothetical protein
MRFVLALPADARSAAEEDVLNRSYPDSQPSGQVVLGVPDRASLDGETFEVTGLRAGEQPQPGVLDIRRVKRGQVLRGLGEARAAQQLDIDGAVGVPARGLGAP